MPVAWSGVRGCARSREVRSGGRAQEGGARHHGRRRQGSHVRADLREVRRVGGIRPVPPSRLGSRTHSAQALHSEVVSIEEEPTELSQKDKDLGYLIPSAVSVAQGDISHGGSVQRIPNVVGQDEEYHQAT